MLFWACIFASLALIGGLMLTIALKAREVPDNHAPGVRHRWNPETIRLIAYGLMILVCLLAAMYELSLYESKIEVWPGDRRNAPAGR